jgi:hypothetical protein
MVDIALPAQELCRVLKEMGLADLRGTVTARHLRAWVVTLRKAADALDAQAAETLARAGHCVPLPHKEPR